VHEETLTGSVIELAQALASPRGEYTIVVPRKEVIDQEAFTPSETDIRDIIGQLTEYAATSKRAAAREVGKKFGLSARQVYELAKKAPF
jgi:16S rRNA C1402 (ribose-2'-O) methylase RsmI